MQRPARTAKQNDEKDAENLMISYRKLNDFLCAYINHSVPAYTYSIRERTFWEKLFNYEFENSNDLRGYGEEETVFLVGK